PPPHSKQNFAPAGSSLRHFVQVSVTRAPHSKQNFAWDGFSCWNRGHFMPEPPSSHAGEGRNGGPRVTDRLSHGQGHRRDGPRQVRGVSPPPAPPGRAGRPVPCRSAGSPAAAGRGGAHGRARLVLAIVAE